MGRRNTTGADGNLSYRTWHARMVGNSDSFMFRFLPENLLSAAIEIVPYFTDSFGNSSRIDCGTGHETNFLAWLYCLAKLGVIEEEDYPAVLMRKLQVVYCLEPAGSHGV